MQSLRFKFGDRRNDWKCCFCCHVRTGTIFIGVWHLMLHIMLLSVFAVVLSYPKEDLDPVLPTPLSEIDNINFEVTLNNDPSIRPPAQLPHHYRDFWEKRANSRFLITFCTFIMTLLLLYGAVRGKPSLLMPFFCMQVFDFCATSISAVGYLCYPSDINKILMQNNDLPMREELLKLHTQTLGLFVAVVFIIIMLIKAYCIAVLWSCYKYLTLRQVAGQRTIQFIDTDLQNMLHDLPDYETATKKLPTPPPSYASAVLGQNQNMGNSFQPLTTQSMAVPAVQLSTAPAPQYQVQVPSSAPVLGSIPQQV